MSIDTHNEDATQPLVAEAEKTEDQVPQEPMLPEYTEEEVAEHNTLDDCWLIVGEPGEKKVYDVTKFLDDHPGGPEIILDVAGQNATADFDDIGHSNDAKKQLEEYLIGKVKGDVKLAEKAGSSSGSGSGISGAGSSSASFVIVLSIVVAIIALFLQFRPVE